MRSRRLRQDPYNQAPNQEPFWLDRQKQQGQGDLQLLSEFLFEGSCLGIDGRNAFYTDMRIKDHDDNIGFIG